MGFEPILKVPQTFVLTTNTNITVVLPRLELGIRDPNSLVLPLHYKTIRAGSQDRTGSIPTWKDGAPPLMRYLHCGEGEARTLNLLLAKQTLSQLSYIPWYFE